uniref:Uncharacterized protein n=1 Tax=Chrysemys picta bellii TaxID=8478 RepID=A0A8C3HF48_CHRPI
MAGALLEPHKLVPTPFEGQHFDPYDYYSLTERYSSECPPACPRAPPGAPHSCPTSPPCPTPALQPPAMTVPVTPSPQPCPPAPRGTGASLPPPSPPSLPPVPGGCSRKGRSKREAAGNTNRPNPAGHERKIALKLQRSERRRGQE